MKKIFLFSILSLILFSCSKDDDSNNEIYTWSVKSSIISTSPEGDVLQEIPIPDKTEKLTEQQVIEFVSQKFTLPEGSVLISDDMNIKGDVKFRKVIYKPKSTISPFEYIYIESSMEYTKIKE